MTKGMCHVLYTVFSKVNKNMILENIWGLGRGGVMVADSTSSLITYLVRDIE
jgi:hypothetical protein